MLERLSRSAKWVTLSSMVDGTRQHIPLQAIVRALAAALSVLCGLVVLELAQFGGGRQTLDLGTSIWTVFLILAPLAPVAVLLSIGKAIVLLKGRKGLWTVAFVLFVAMLPLANVLSQGEGVQRTGMWGAVLLGVPLSAAAFGVAFLSVLRRLSARRLGLPATLAAVAAIACRECNRHFLTGLYPSVHDAAFVVELALWLTAVTLVAQGRFTGKASLFVVSLGVVVSGFAWVRAPEESFRSSFSRGGFHSRRLLRWRGDLMGKPNVEVPDADPVLVEQIQEWRRVAARATEQFRGMRADKKPLSVLWVTIDTLRADRLTAALTPNLHDLATRSARFRTAYSQFPATHFSFGSMFHGRYPSATAFFRSLNGSGDQGLSLNEAFRGSGFRTGASIGFTNEWLDTPGFRWLLRHFEYVNHKRRGYPSYAGEHFVDSAKATLDEMKGERFFYWLHLMDPHHDYVYHSGLTEGEDLIQRYEGEVRYADQQFGRMLKYLQESGLSDSTVIVVNADHGEALGEHGGSYYHATSLLEEQLRVPLVVHVPGLKPMESDVNVECVDIAETFQDVLDIQKRFPTQGTSLLPLMLDRTTEESWPNFAHSELPKTGTLTVVPPASMLRVGMEKIIVHEEEGYTEFFDLGDDPDELRDISTERPRRRRELMAMLRGLQDWSHRFDRGLDPAEQRHLFVQKARRLMSDFSKPLEVQQGLLLANRTLLTELAPFIEELALNTDIVPELRIEALSALGVLNDEGYSRVAKTFAQSEYDVLRWLALVGDGASSADGKAPADTRFERWNQICLPQSSAIGWSAATRASREAVVRPLASSTRRVHARRQLIQSVRTVDEAQSLLRFIEDDNHLPMSTEDEQLLLTSLWRADRALWLDHALKLVSNRYLKVALKNQILSRLHEVPKAACAELALRMLTGFERGFQDRLRSVAGPIVGENDILLLTRHQRRLNTLYEDLRAGRMPEVLDGYDLLIARSSKNRPTVALRFAVEATRLLLASDHRRALRVLRGVSDEAALVAASDYAEWYRTLLGEYRLLQEYRPDDGPLSADSKIRVSAVEILGGRRFEVSSSCHAWVDIENKSERHLPRGSSRVRVLWHRLEDASQSIYGTEMNLPRDLPSQSVDSVHLRMIVPDSPGTWIGRLILNQQNFSRFHTAESPSGLIEVEVVGADAARLPVSFDGGALMNQWSPSGLLKDVDLDDDGVLSWICTGYEQGLSGPLIEIGADGAECVIRCSINSPLSGARTVVLFLTPEGTKQRRHAGYVALGAHEGLQDVVIRIKADDFTSKRYRPTIVVGARPGVARILGVTFK